MTQTILLKGRGIRKEAAAGVAINPGYLIERTSANLFQPHSSAGQTATPMFAVEDELAGKDITQAYAINDQVVVETLPSGAEVYALVAAAAAAVVIGDLLESAGDGTLRLFTPPAQAVAEGGALNYTITQYDKVVVAKALEAVNNAAGGVEARLKVEVV